MREIHMPDFAKRTTLRIGGHALAELVLESEEEIYSAFEKAAQIGGAPFFIGRGSNLLARDGLAELVLFRLEFADKIQIIQQVKDKTIVSAGANVPLSRLLRFCMQNGLSGLEGLAGIPGTVGGACAMNAGSFGTETGACLHSLQVFADGKLQTVNHADLLPVYRKMRFRNFNECPLITKASFILTPAVKSVIFDLMNLNFLQKKSKQPVTAWSAGCTFKNPSAGVAAGKLLEEAGFKGKKMGGMAFSSRHANFMVNEGRGNAGAALELLDLARKTVFERFGILLEAEVRIIP